jgi:hypothetical protein
LKQASLIGVVWLRHAVIEFQNAAKDLIRVADHEQVLGGDAFYKVGLDAFLEEAYVRYRTRLGQEKLFEYFAAKTNSDCANTIASFSVQGAEGF